MKKNYLYLIIFVIVLIVASIIYAQFSFRNMAPGLDYKDDINKLYASGGEAGS